MRSHRLDSLRTPAAIVAACLAVVVVCLFLTVAYAAHSNATQKARAVATCERGNIVRQKQNSVILFLNKKFGYTGIPTPLVDCTDIS